MNEVKLYIGDALERLKELEDNSIDSIVTDPPYEIGYGGKSWDSSGIAFSVPLWTEALRVLKPGGHLLSFGATRTYHRMAVAVEDAGFEIRDTVTWIYGSGQPVGQDIGKGIDKQNGTFEQREAFHYKRVPVQSGKTGVGTQKTKKDYALTSGASPEAKKWDGWNTNLRPSVEPVVLARKPLAPKTTIVNNVLQYGTGALNIDATRLTYQASDYPLANDKNPKGRWMPNLAVDADTATSLDKQLKNCSKFFYVAKPSQAERPIANGLKHPTVKPLELMKQLITLVTPPNGTVLDIFAGSGTTLEAAAILGFDSVGFELTEDYVPLIEERAKRSGFILKVVETTP